MRLAVTTGFGLSDAVRMAASATLTLNRSASRFRFRTSASRTAWSIVKAPEGACACVTNDQPTMNTVVIDVRARIMYASTQPRSPHDETAAATRQTIATNVLDRKR